MAIAKITTQAIEFDAITTSLIADGSITADDIADGSITGVKLAPTLDLSAVTISSITTTGNTSVGGDLSVTGNLIVSGTTTTVNTETINLADNIITLNSNEAATPTENAGLEVERGISTNVQLRWNESTDRWEFTNDGITFYNLPTSSDLAGAANDATITLSAGTALSGGGDFTTDQSTNETITFNHATVSRTNTTSSASPAAGGTFTVIDSVSSTSEGHVSGANTKTITLPTDAETLDGLDSTQFLRSDAADTKTAGDLSFSDNVKAIFGAGSDLQIYHESTSGYSIIQETGQGNLLLTTNGPEVQILGQGGADYSARFIQDGSVELYYDSSKKLATTSTGIDVTGTVTADGLTVDGVISARATGGEGGQLEILNPDNASTGLIFDVSTADTARIFSTRNNASFQIGQLVGTGGGINLYTSASPRLRIESNGDISFYEDTGTTPKFFWDASAERLGIGTSSPSRPLDVVGSVQIQSNSPGFFLNDLNSSTDNKIIAMSLNDGELFFQYRNDSLGGGGNYVRFPRSGNQVLGMEFLDNGNVKNFISNAGDSYFTSGNVGIGTSSPSSLLHVNGSTTLGGNVLVGGQLQSLAGAATYIDFGTAGQLSINTAGSERLRINSSGNVGINKTNPSTALDVNGTVTATDFSGNGSGLSNVNAATLDSLDSTQFLRSDTNDTTTGNITISRTDPGLYLNETDTTTTARLVLAAGDLYIQAGAAGSGATSSSGDIRITGYFNNNVNAFTVRTGGVDNEIWHAGNDGSGSGLDADLLDGQQGSYYQKKTTVQDAAPSGTTGDFWYESDTATLYVYYSGAWVDTAPGIQTSDNLQINSLGVGTAASGTTGEIRATNDVTAYYSDARLKTFEGTIPDAVDKVKQLNGYYFRENEIAKSLGYDNDNRQVGVSAQEVEAVLPEVVTEAPISDEYLTVKYEKMVPLLIEAIKEQQAMIDELKNEINKLKGNN